MRKLIILSIISLLGVIPICTSQNKQEKQEKMSYQDTISSSRVKLFLCGDVMTGRGIDQALQENVDPILYESYVKDARDYLLLAEQENGPIKDPVSYKYIWGDAIKIWEENSPQFKIINLETSITTNADPWPGKGIHYRMHPENVKALSAAGIDHCSLANNHTLDWGRQGLLETINTLDNADIAYSGAGKNEQEAKKPSVLDIDNGRVLIFSYGSPGSGIPREWAAETGVSGVNYLPDLSKKTLEKIKINVDQVKQQQDIVIFSVHWGGNWGYQISEDKQKFAHQLIDMAGVDLVFGHSSHHPMGIEVYNEKLIIYGAGDFINDYEGISGHEDFRGELTLMYFPELDPGTGDLLSLKMIPMEIKNFKLHKAKANDAVWLEQVLDRESKKIGTSVRREADNSLRLDWKM